MMSTDTLSRRENSTADFNTRFQRADGARLVASLSEGFTLLRDLLYRRLHDDVEQAFGADSMLTPISPLKTEQELKLEIEAFEIATALREFETHGYLPTDPDWRVEWIGRLRFGDKWRDMLPRVRHYTEAPDAQRARGFHDALLRISREASKAPLVLFRLFPLAARIAVQLAFDDVLGARQLRHEQIGILPAIADCPECHGRLIDNGELCRCCGNPIWRFRWLTSTD